MYDKFFQLTEDGPTSVRKVTAAFLMTSEDKDLISEDKAVTANPDLPVPPPPKPEDLMQGMVRASEHFWEEGDEVRLLKSRSNTTTTTTKTLNNK